MVKMQITTMAMLLVLCLLGCAPGPRPTLKRFYEGLREPLEGIDLSALKGKKIVIDAGHGGVFRGARGIYGTDEADVNLGVALHLWGLLEEAGASVTLTRKTDRDFVDGDSLRLRDDLKARVKIANDVDPDIFISLHHNADIKADATFNEIQVYYKLGDDGPSLDIARAIAKHLLRNLGEDKNQLVPGNYYILRNADCPSVLCEPSFITNPEVEAKIRLPEKQRLEAAVYFLALTDYFARGVPRIAGVLPAGAARTEVPMIEVLFDDDTLVDASTVDIRLDGVRLASTRTVFNRFLASSVAPLRGGKHVIQASARAYGGNASRVAASEFDVRIEPAIISLLVAPPVASNVYPQKVTALVLDRNGNHVIDSTSVTFSWKNGSLGTATSSGEASVYIGKDIPFGVDEISARCGDVKTSTGLSGETKVAQRSSVSPRQSAEPHGKVGPSAPSQVSPCHASGFVVDSDGKPLRDATVTAPSSTAQGASATTPGSDTSPYSDTSLRATALSSQTPGVSWGSAITDQNGFFVIALKETPCSLAVTRQGFRKAYVTLDNKQYPTIRLDQFYRGLARDLCVTVDAEGGGEATGWVGPTGISASTLNLAVARRLRGLLESIGIKTYLTRETDRNTTKEERVTEAESHRSALLVSIAHAASDTQGVAIGHYPTSLGGAGLSQFLQQEMKTSLGWEAPISDNAEYLLQQTSCPAVKVTFLAPLTVEQDALLSEPCQVWMRSYAIVCGVLRYLGISDDAETTFSISGRVADGGKPSQGALVVIDGTFETTTDDNGEFRLRLIENGPHAADIFSGSGERRSIVFDERTGSIQYNLGL